MVTGLAVLERKVPVTTDTLFQIGSTTKVYNAAVVMSLVDRLQAGRPRRYRGHNASGPLPFPCLFIGPPTLAFDDSTVRIGRPRF